MEPVIVDNVIVHSSDPSSSAPPGWVSNGIIWLNSSDGSIYKRIDNSWTLLSHTHEEGITEEIPMKKVETMVFDKGILVKYG